MKTTIFNSMLGMMLISITLCFSSCGGNSVDKSKCTSDYVYYERVWKMYSELFEKLNENQAIDEILMEYTCKDVKKALKDKKLSSLYFYVSCLTGVYFSTLPDAQNPIFHMDEGDPFLGTDEEIFEIAKNGEKFSVQFKFNFETMISDRKKTLNSITEVVLIYEDGDWKVYDFINKSFLNSGLRERLSLQ